MPGCCCPPTAVIKIKHALYRVAGRPDVALTGGGVCATATVELEFAFDDAGPWNATGQSWTTPINTTYNDGQDGQIIYYRLRITAWTSGNVTMTVLPP